MTRVCWCWLLRWYRGCTWWWEGGGGGVGGGVVVVGVDGIGVVGVCYGIGDGGVVVVGWQ